VLVGQEMILVGPVGAVVAKVEDGQDIPSENGPDRGDVRNTIGMG
jgi:hypothetical protein